MKIKSLITGGAYLYKMKCWHCFYRPCQYVILYSR